MSDTLTGPKQRQGSSSLPKKSQNQLTKTKEVISKEKPCFPVDLSTNLTQNVQNFLVDSDTNTSAHAGETPEPRHEQDALSALQLDFDRASVEAACTTLATHFNLDVEELKLGLQATQAAKEAIGRATTASPEVAKRLKDLARLAGLKLDYWQKLNAIQFPRDGFSREQEAAAAARLSKTFNDTRQLQCMLGIKPTKKDARVGKAESFRTAYMRAHPKIKTASSQP